MTDEEGGLPEKAKNVGTAFGWGTAGYLIGLFVAVIVPDAFVADQVLAGVIGAIFGIIGYFDPKRFVPTPRDRSQDPMVVISRGLLDAEKMFQAGTITEKELIDLRMRILSGDTKRLPPGP